MQIRMENFPRNRKGRQKVEVYIDPWDTLDVSVTLANIILPTLVQLKEQEVCPMIMYEVDCPRDEQGNPTDEADYEANIKWNLILDKMIWAFEQVLNPDVRGVRITGKDERHPEDEKKFNTLSWEIHSVGNVQTRLLNHPEIQEGFELFGKYYWSLME